MSIGLTTRPGSEVVVLGAGIAGLYAAKRLAKSGYRVRVIDRSEQCGGAHRSRNIGPYTFDIGSIFYEQRARIFQLADGLRELCPAVHRKQRRISPSGNVLHYPLDPKEVLRSSPLAVPLNLANMAASRMLVRRDGTLDAICRKRLGQRFFDQTGLRAYISRFHHADPTQIDERFFFERMGFIDKATQGTGLLRFAMRNPFSKKAFNAKTVKHMHIRPYGGFDHLFAPIKRQLEAEGVEFLLGEELQSIRHDTDKFFIETSHGRHETPGLVSTLPLESLYYALFGESTKLQSVNMTTLFVSAGGLNKRTGNVLFNFDKSGDWKRATVYSRLYPEAPTQREFMGVEVTLPNAGQHDPEQAFDDFRSHMSELGIASDISLEGSEYLDAVYPMHAIGSHELLANALERVRQTGIITAGRQGRFEYLPTSTGVIRQVAQELDKVYDLTPDGSPERATSTS